MCCPPECGPQQSKQSSPDFPNTDFMKTQKREQG